MDITALELLAQQRLAETGLSPAELLSLDMADYARLTGRPTIGQVAAQALETAPPGTPRQDPAPAQTAPAAPGPGPQAAEPQGMDPNSQEYFLAWRAQRQRGGEGVGLFDSVSSGSAQYTAAVRAQAGRTAWNSSNVVESPRIDRAYVQPDPVDSRPAVQRFASPGGVFGS